MAGWSVPEAIRFLHGRSKAPCRFLVRVDPFLVATDGHLLVAKPGSCRRAIPKMYRSPRETFAEDIRNIVAGARGRRYREWLPFVRWLDRAGDGTLTHVRIHGHVVDPTFVWAALNALRAGFHVAENRHMQRVSRVGISLRLVVPRCELDPLHILTPDGHAVVMPMRLSNVWPEVGSGK